MSELTEAKVRQIVHEEINAPAGKIAGIEGRIAKLETSVATLETGVATLETGVAKLEKGVAELETGVAELNSEVTRLGVMFEQFDAKMDAVAELVSTTVETRTGVVDHDTRIRRLEDDMLVVKATLKK